MNIYVYVEYVNNKNINEVMRSLKRADNVRKITVKSEFIDRCYGETRYNNKDYDLTTRIDPEKIGQSDDVKDVVSVYTEEEYNRDYRKEMDAQRENWDGIKGRFLDIKKISFQGRCGFGSWNEMDCGYSYANYYENRSFPEKGWKNKNYLKWQDCPTENILSENNKKKLFDFCAGTIDFDADSKEYHRCIGRYGVGVVMQDACYIPSDLVVECKYFDQYERKWKRCTGCIFCSMDDHCGIEDEQEVDYREETSD